MHITMRCYKLGILSLFLILNYTASFGQTDFSACAGQRASFVDWHGGYGSMSLDGVTYTVFCMNYDLDVPPPGHGYTIVSSFPTCGTASAVTSCVFGGCADDDAGQCVWAATCSSNHSGTYGCFGSPGANQGVLYGRPDDPANQNFVFRVTTTPDCAPSCNLVIECDAQNVSCEGNDGWVAVTGGSGNQGAVSYLWNTGATTYAIENLGPGTYTVTVTDLGVGAACTQTCSYTLTDNYSGGAYFLNLTGTDPSSCGANDGQVEMTSGGGGNAPVTAEWSTGAVDVYSISGLSGGTYSLTVTDNFGCTVTSSYTINEPGGPSVSCSKTDPSCGASDGTATANASGGASPYTYSWSSGGSDASISGLAAGEYTVTVTDNSGCVDVCSVTLESPGGPTATCSVGSAPDCGQSNGSASVSVSGGATPYSYSWSSGGSGASESGLAAGNYTVTVTDANSCSTTCDVTLSEPGGPTASCSVGSHPGCGESNGSASVSVSGGATPYSYSWSSGGSGASESGLAAGNYTVTVTDANSCSTTCDVTLSEPGGPTASCSVGSHPGCNIANGSASVSPSGGATPYSYNWSSGESSASISGKGPGNYAVTVTDANNCSTTCDVTLTEPGGPSVSCSITTEPSCFMSDGQIASSASGGTPPYSYAWSSGGNSANEGGLVGGNYTLTVTDANNCTATCDVTLPEPTGCCEVTISQTMQSECMDNGTPTNVNDDYFQITVNATNTSPSLPNYQVVVNAAANGSGGTVLATVNYNTPVTVGIPTIPPFEADGSSTYEITIRDSSTPDCFDTFTTTPVDYCFTCPTYNMVTSSETEICDGETVATIQASVTDVVSPDQVRFVYFTSPQFGTAMYTGGTHIGTVPAIAGFASVSNISFPSAGSYFVYAILDPPPTVEPSCRPFAFTEITVHPLPDARLAVVDEEICEDRVAYVELLSSVAGITYQLRNDSDDSNVGRAMRGSGRTLRFPIFGLSTIGVYTYNILATNDDTGCSVELINKPIVEVKDCDTPWLPRLCDDSANLPCHFIPPSPQIYLGNGIASGSDNGVQYANDIHPGNRIHLPMTIVNNTGINANVTAWIDWNADEDFDDANEQIALLTLPVGTYSGTYLYSHPVDVPVDVSQDIDLQARFRISTDAATIAEPCNPDCAPDGEIEDYILRIGCRVDHCLPVSLIRTN